MSIWLEIRCERRTNPGCFSDANHGPMQLSSDDNASVLSSVRDMRKDAKGAGWKKLREGLVCPACFS